MLYSLLLVSVHLDHPQGAHAARHSVHIPQPETHAATTLQNLQRCIFTDYFYKCVTLAKLSMRSLRMVQVD